MVSAFLTAFRKLSFTGGVDSRAIESPLPPSARDATELRLDAGESRHEPPPSRSPAHTRAPRWTDEAVIPEEAITHERARFVDDLLSYMTLEEKLGQLDLFHAPDDPGLEKAIAAGRIGGVGGTDVPSRLQGLATERSRLGIPLLLTAERVDTALSPWALAASWDEELARAVGGAAARDAIGGGFNCMAAPRTGTAAGLLEGHIATAAPHLAARLAGAFARGADGEGEDRRSAVLAVPRWASMPDSNALAWSQELIQHPGVAAIDCLALDRQTAQRAGFAGVLVAECRRIADIVARRFTLTSARSALESAERVLAAGPVGEHDLDVAVRGVLAAKHALGLFRDPQRIIAPPSAGPGLGRDDHRVRATFVLLRNEAGILPLSPVSDRILVVGAADGAAAACADALGRAGIGHSLAPGLAQRRPEESWATPVAGDHFALSLTGDAARRADFVLVALEDRHFHVVEGSEWRQPTPATLAMLRGLSLGNARLVAILATAEPVDLSAADQHFAAVLQCWQPLPGFEEALSDVLSGRFGPQGRMPASAGRFLLGHGLGFGESALSGYALAARSHHVEAAVRVRNLGSFPMRETVQAYVRGADDALRLIEFRHVTLQPGETAPVTFELGLGALGTPGTGGRLELAPGRYEILIGKSLARLDAKTIEITPALARTMMLRERSFLRLAAG